MHQRLLFVRLIASFPIWVLPRLWGLPHVHLLEVRVDQPDESKSEGRIGQD